MELLASILFSACDVYSCRWDIVEDGIGHARFCFPAPYAFTNFALAGVSLRREVVMCFFFLLSVMGRR